MIKQSLLLSGCAVAAGLFIADRAAARSIELRTVPLLFADDSGIEEQERVVRTVHAARRRDAPVLVPDQPWEFQRAYMWGSVHHDEGTGTFRMWYLCRLPPDHRIALLYATSNDGLHWEKPPLGLHAFDRSTANNIFDPKGASSASVIVDPFERDPAGRHKMLVYRKGGYRAASSPDGIRWTDMQDKPVLDGGDTVMVAQDPATGEYLAYHKRPATIRGFPRRVVWLARSRDFKTWSEPELVFAPDEADDDWLRRPQDRTEVYVMSVFPHAGGYIGLPAIFRNTPQEQDRSIHQVSATGAIDIQLATSPDGRAWRRSWPRIAIIPRGPPGTYDGGAILNTATAPIHVGDETWVYYTAINTGHGAAVPPKAMCIGRADWRLHGFVSLDAGPEGGKVETKPLRLGSASLLINADASGGRLRAALREADGRPIAGYDFDESVPLTADATRWTAGWRGKAGVPTDRPVRVVIEMSNTRLFSLSSRGRSGE